MLFCGSVYLYERFLEVRLYACVDIATVGRFEVGWFAGMTHFSFLFCFFSVFRYFGDCCKVFSQYVNVTFYAVMLHIGLSVLMLCCYGYSST